MSPKTKASLEQLIRSKDVLDYQSEHIDRKASASSKKNKLSEFSRAVEKALSNQRDILLIAIQLR